MRTEKEIKKELRKYTRMKVEKLILIPSEEMAVIRASAITLRWVLNEEKKIKIFLFSLFDFNVLKLIKYF